MAFYVKNKNYTITDFAESPATFESNLSYPTIRDSYLTTLNDANVGFYLDSDTKYIKYSESGYFGGAWGSRKWNPPGYTFSGDVSLAGCGSTPLPSTGMAHVTNGCALFASAEQHKYFAVSYWDNKLRHCFPTSTTLPSTTSTDWVETSSGFNANVVCITMCAGGGGGGGGVASNPVFGDSRANAGAGGGGGGWMRFLYKFSTAATAENPVVLWFDLGTAGTGGAAGYFQNQGYAGTAGEAGTNTVCRVGGYLGNTIATCYGGGGGAGGGYASDYTAKGGEGGSTSCLANTSAFYVIQRITGGRGGTGNAAKGDANNNRYGGDGESISAYSPNKQTIVNYSVFTFGSVCDAWENENIGVGVPGGREEAFPNYSECCAASPGGGASAQSMGTLVGSYRAQARYGLGGNGGSAMNNGSIDNYSNPGTVGGPGFVRIDYVKDNPSLKDFNNK